VAENEKLSQKREKSFVSVAGEEKVHPFSIAVATILIAGFLTIVIAVQQFPETWFVQTFLRGYKGLVAGVLFSGVVLAVASVIETKINKQQADVGSKKG